MEGAHWPLAPSLLCKVFVLLILCFAAQSDLTGAFTPTRASVRLPLGHVAGFECPSNPEVVQFLGIPFGRAPVGELRFRPPAPYDEEYPNGVLLANEKPPACLQGALGPDGPIASGSEDCLFLNIWAPASATPGSNLPVKVFIHGGAWSHGSASLDGFNGCQSVDTTQTILVNIQYRLGPFGFMAHPDTYAESNTTGNWGVLDQQLALKWLQRHVSAFGGDPTRVLLFGQSAGAWAVALHVSLPSSAGLFSAATSESVPGWDFATPEQSYANTQALLANLVECSTNPAAAPARQLACLRAASPAALLAAVPPSNLLLLSEPRHQLFSPVVDGTVVPRQILEAFDTGNFNRVPYLLGGTANEGLFMLATAFPDLQSLALDDLLSFLRSVSPNADAKQVLNLYPEADYAEYEAPIYRRFADIWTDFYMTCPLSRAMSAMWREGVPLYRYYFTHPPSCPFRRIPLATGGVAHDDDNYFVFNQTTNVPPPDGQCNFTDAEKIIADLIVRAWAAMARNGAAVVQNGAPWTQWDPQQQMTLLIDTPPKFESLDFTKRCSVYWENAGLGFEKKDVLASVVDGWPKMLLTP